MAKRDTIPVTIRPNDVTSGIELPNIGGDDTGDRDLNIPGIDTIDPASIDAGSDSGSDTGGGTATRRRGRPAGSRNATKTQVSKNAVGLESILFNLHMMAAGFFDASELVLGADEAKAYAESIQKVSRHYNAILDEKTLDWINLFMVAGGIYGARIFAISQRAKKEKPLAKVQPISVQRPPVSNPVPPVEKTGTTASPSDVWGTGGSAAPIFGE